MGRLFSPGQSVVLGDSYQDYSLCPDPYPDHGQEDISLLEDCKDLSPS